MDVLKNLYCPTHQSMEKRKNKSGDESKGGDRDKAFLGWYTASSRYRARNAKDREAIGRATANKT
jgi:hypothetical protein